MDIEKGGVRMNIQQRNNINIRGTGEDLVVLAHGFGSNQQMWQYITPALEENRQLLLFDYVGSGNSDKEAYSTEKYKDLTGYAQDLIDIIDAYNIEGSTFIGHSVSGMIGMLASFKRPQAFSKMIMIGASPCYLNDGDYMGGFSREDVAGLFQMMEMNFAGWASHLAPIVTDPQNSPTATKQLEMTFKSNDAAIAREFAEATFLADHRHQLAEMTVPTVLIQGIEDAIVPQPIAHYLHDHIAGSELTFLDVKGHYPHISQPQKTVEKILHYI